MLQNKKRIISLILMLTLMITSLVFTAVSTSAADGEWVLVTDVSELKAGDQVIIAAKEYNYALSTTQNTNNRGQTAITKSGNTLTNVSSSVQVITLESGNTAGTFFFKVDTGYLYASSSSSNQLKTRTSNNSNASYGEWKISISSGTASIVANRTGRNTMQYNQSSSLFACYASASQKALCIYKFVEATSSTCEQHTPAGAGDVTAPTCTTQGYTTYTCASCVSLTRQMKPTLLLTLMQIAILSVITIVAQ